MRILITGVAGFIGCNLSRALLKKGYEIYGIDDLSVGKREYLPQGMKFIQGDICIDTFHFNKSIDLIIHLASRKIPREGNPDRVLRENALGIMRVVDLARIYNARIIYMSSSEVYGISKTTSERYDYFTFGQPHIVRWVYGLSKLWGENYLFSSEGIEFKIIRLFATFGPWNCRHWRGGPVPVFCEQALSGDPFTIHGSGTQSRCFQYVDDAVDGILKVMNWGFNRDVFNIGNPKESIAIYQLAEKIYYLIHGEPREDFDDKLVKYIKPINNPNLNYVEIPHRVPNILKAKEQLDFDPKISLEEGLKLTIDWHKEQRKLESMENIDYACNEKRGKENMQ